jgi:hypothetical protein
MFGIIRKAVLCLSLALQTSELALALPPAHPDPNIYSPERWRGGDYVWGFSEQVPDSGFFAFTHLEQNEVGYPMRTSLVMGISDTTTIEVWFEKRQGGGYPIGSLSPETWFTPVIYPRGWDRRKMPTIGDSSTFHSRFKFWVDIHKERISKPDTIPQGGLGVNTIQLLYEVWGIPPGRYLLTMKETSLAPNDLKLCMNYDLPVWISTPNDLQDTLSAYAGCVQRAIWADSLDDAKVWADTILYFNPKSLIGYRRLAQVLQLQGQKTAALAAFDSAAAIAARFGDPALPPESGMNEWQKRWYQNFILDVNYNRWCLENGRYPGFR